MKKNLLLLLVSVAVYGSGVNAAGLTDKYRTRSGTECSQEYNTGRTMEFGFKQDSKKDGVEVFISYNIELGRSKINSKRINCQKTMRLEEERAVLENERLRLELELLRRQVNAPAEATATIAPPIADANDW